ncbi:toll-like receptor 3 isoform X2 [Erpetoichthys calabaricus]|uniref:toll-like receptor 3 isoform X2 n=2 Tax=Erpetoichthys calabaricus TaxID=27687 RepID=UPI002234D1A1|nr:toll-like receptor 3 isoform X2 [Erpetoichthys calabaricus]
MKVEAFFYFLLKLFSLHLSSVECKTKCLVKGERVDCTRLKLTAVPSDLPENISDLDMAHNQLHELPSSAMSRYKELIYLDASYNSIQKIDPELCLVLPHLHALKVQHNEVHLLSEKDLKHCLNLTELNLSGNRLKMTADTFRHLQNLKILDVSKNELKSVNLGMSPQLSSLQVLNLSENKISEIKKEDFIYLSNSSLLLLKLESLPLKIIERGCLSMIGQLHGLVLDNSKLDSKFIEDLSYELSETKISNLSLKNTDISIINNSTFRGLNETHLTVLDLSKNQIDIISEYSFKWLSKLEHLYLQENFLDHLENTTFYGLSSLKSLNLGRALIRGNKTSTPVVDDFSFQSLENLEYLVLQDNEFTGLKDNTFSGLRNLKYLTLSNCNINLNVINSRTLSSLSQSPLLFLNLTSVGISQINNGTFSWFPHLIKLYIGHNKIMQTLSGEEFRGLENIEEIYLSYNQKITLRPLSFCHVKTIRTLMLGRTLAGSLDFNSSPFQGLQNLTVLDLSNNNIANINDALFSGLEHLKILKLQHNNLARLWKSGNPGGPVLFLKGLINLRILQLESNGFDEIPADGFKGLSQLIELDLGLNDLNFFPETLFKDLSSLRVLGIQKNLIISVPENTFKKVFSNLHILYMGKNPFDCTCESMYWFVNWLNKTNTSIPGLNSEYICNSPPKYYNSSISDFDISPCKDLAPFAFFLSSAIVVLVFLFSAILIQFQGWRVQFFWNVLVNRILGYKEIDLGENRFEYDAYIIHAAKDATWVDRNVIPLRDKFQNMFHFSSEERDIAAGTFELEAIIESMSKSRKIVFIITNALLNDPWCKRFKVHQAMHQAIEQSRDSIVLLFLEDIPDYKLHQTLFLRRGMFKSQCILYWPVQNDRLQAFYQKMRVALGSSNRVN